MFNPIKYCILGLMQIRKSLSFSFLMILSSTSFFLLTHSFASKRKPAQESPLKRNLNAEGDSYQEEKLPQELKTNAEEDSYQEGVPHKPKIKKEVLQASFDEHLKTISKNCDLKPKKRKKELDKKIQNLNDFLSESLQDPYMDYKTELLFRDVLSLMEKENLIDSESFSLAYRLLYNINEKTQPKDYHHEWATVFYNSLKCLT